jgi:hypothetical protein
VQSANGGNKRKALRAAGTNSGKNFLFIARILLVGAACLAFVGCSGISGTRPPDYGQAFAQCAASTVTAAQELAGARSIAAAYPPPAVAVAEVTAFFERGNALIEAVRHGRISETEARAELAENMSAAQSRVQAEARNNPRNNPFSGFTAPRMTTCNFAGQSMYCNKGAS